MDHNETDDTDDGRGVGRRSVLGALGLGAGASLLGGAGWLLDQEAEGTRRLTALLSGENQVPPVATTGTGTATFTLNQDGTLDWRVVVVDLAGITQAHIHEGGADENGPVVAPLFQFTPNPDGTGEGFPRDATAEDPIVRSGTVEDQQLVEDVLANPDQYYVNVHTVQNPAGAIRGQMMAEAEATTFTVRIENVSTEQTLMTPEGSQAVPLSPGAYAVYPTPDLPEPAATETPPVGTEEPGTETEAPAETETEPDTPTEAETPTAAETETPVETEAEIEQMSVQAGTETETPGVVTGRPDDETETPGMETPTPAPETPTPAPETPTPEEETETPAPGTPTGTPTPVPTPTVTPAMPEVANPIFTPGQPVVPNGLEQIAEDGDPGALAESLAAAPNVAQSGTFNRPVGIEEPGPIGPGDAYEFVVTGTPEQRLTFATMFIPSNDLFYAPGADGISLFEGGEPISGDVTEQIALWDAGTEVNEQPGVGPNQAPRQEFPGDGEEEGNRVRLAEEVPDGFDYPATSEVIEVTITPGVAPAMETPAGVSPTPTEEAEEETPTEEAEEETPTEEAEEETPTEEAEEETPTEEAEEETPTEEAEEETPTEAPAEETPTEAPAEGTPTDTPTSGGGDGGGY